MTPRNPVSGQWSFVSPQGAASSQAPQLPQPGPTALDAAQGVPFRTFSPSLSPCQSGGDQTAVSTPPGMAGPCVANPTTPMQDLNQAMGQTVVEQGGYPQQSGDADDDC